MRFSPLQLFAGSKLKIIRFCFWNCLYYPVILVKVGIYKYLLGPDAFSSVLLKIQHPPLIARFLIRYGASISSSSIIQSGFYIHCPRKGNKPFNNLSIGENSYIDKFVFIDLTNSVKIGNNTRLSCGVKIYSHLADHDRGENYITTHSSEVIIGNNCRLYPNVIVTSGTIIKDYVLVGAGSVVLNNKVLENNSLYGGVPAKLKSKF